MLRISPGITIAESEMELSAMRAQGAGGQNVNKVASAIHLRFDVRASSLPESCKRRLLGLGDRRVTRTGVIVIKSQEFRSQEQNRAAARERLAQLVRSALKSRKPRIATRPGPAARDRRLQAKARRSGIKRVRQRRPDLDLE